MRPVRQRRRGAVRAGSDTTGLLRRLLSATELPPIWRCAASGRSSRLRDGARIRGARAVMVHTLEVVDERSPSGMGFFIKVPPTGRMYRVEPARDPTQPRF